MQRTQSAVLCLNTTINVLIFWTEFMMEELELVVAKEYKLEKGAKY